jgi:hypothetical protein
MDMFAPSSFDPNDQDAWANWNLFHIATHNQIYGAALDAGYMINNYPLDYDKKYDAWKENHQVVHQSLDEVLGVSYGTANLADVDFNDLEDFQGWMLFHAEVHQAIKTALGL